MYDSDDEIGSSVPQNLRSLGRYRFQKRLGRVGGGVYHRALRKFHVPLSYVLSANSNSRRYDRPSRALKGNKAKRHFARREIFL